MYIILIWTLYLLKYCTDDKKKGIIFFSTY